MSLEIKMTAADVQIIQALFNVRLIMRSPTINSPRIVDIAQTVLNSSDNVARFSFRQWHDVLSRLCGHVSLYITTVNSFQQFVAAISYRIQPCGSALCWLNSLQTHVTHTGERISWKRRWTVGWFQFKMNFSTCLYYISSTCDFYLFTCWLAWYF